MMKETDPKKLGLALSVAGTVSKIMSGQITNNQGVGALFGKGSNLGQLLGMDSSKKIILVEHRCESCGMILVKCYNLKSPMLLDSTKLFGEEFELDYAESAIQSFEDNAMSRYGNNWGCQIRKANGQGYLDQPVYWDMPRGKKENQNGNLRPEGLLQCPCPSVCPLNVLHALGLGLAAALKHIQTIVHIEAS